MTDSDPRLEAIADLLEQLDGEKVDYYTTAELIVAAVLAAYPLHVTEENQS